MSRQFTLIFAPFPAACRHFDLFEEIPEEGGFDIRGIERNETDVYRIIQR